MYYRTNRTIIQCVLDIVRWYALRVIYRYAHIYEKGVALLLLFFQNAMIGMALDIAQTDNHDYPKRLLIKM